MTNIELDTHTKIGTLLVVLILSLSMWMPHTPIVQQHEAMSAYQPNWAADFHAQIVHAKQDFDSMEKRLKKQVQQIRVQELRPDTFPKVHPKDGTIYY